MLNSVSNFGRTRNQVSFNAFTKEELSNKLKNAKNTPDALGVKLTSEMNTKILVTDLMKCSENVYDARGYHLNEEEGTARPAPYIPFYFKNGVCESATITGIAKNSQYDLVDPQTKKPTGKKLTAKTSAM